MNEKQMKMKNIFNSGEKLQMRVKPFDSLPEDWHKRFPRENFISYHEAIHKLEGKVVNIERILSNGAILIKESSVAFGSDVLEFIEDSFLDDDMFEI
jgi:hypothetical protein